MTKDKKPTYEELEQRLVEAEQMLDALRRGEVDAVLAQEQPIVLRPRELERKLKESETALAEAQALAKVGSWECDVALDQQSWSQEMFRIHGRDPSRGAPNWKGLREHIHPADWPRLGEALQGAMKGRTSYRGEFRVVRPDGATTWIDVIGRTREKQKDGSLKLYGTVQDITERKLVERALAESQEILNRSEEIAKTGGWEFDPATGKQKWTEGTYRIHEVDPDYQPTVEKGLSFFPSPDAYNQISQAVQGVIDEGVPFDLGLPFVTAKGRKRWVRVMGRADRKNGVTKRVLGSIQDVTAQKKAEDNLRQSREELDALLQNVKAGVVVHAPDTSIITANQEASRLLGLSLEQMQGRKAVDPGWRFLREDGSQLPPEEYPVNLALSSRKSIANQLGGIRRPDRDAIIWVLVNANVLLDESGDIAKVITSFVDITERRKYQQDLIRERDLSQKYLDTAGVILLALDKNGRIKMINRKGCELLGFQSRAVLGKHWFNNFIPEDLRQETIAMFNEIMAGMIDKFAYVESPVLSASGEIRLISWFNTVLEDSKGNITGTLSSGEDITEKKASQEAINRLAAIVESSQDAITSKDLDGVITSWNRAAETLYGYGAEEAIGQNIEIVFPEGKKDELKMILRMVRQGKSARIHETVRQHKDGSLIDFSLSVSPVFDDQGKVIGAATIAHDIADMIKIREEKEKLGLQLRQAQKMEAIGTLAGGIAHDFNNILAAIMGYSELAQDSLPADSEAAEYIKTVVDSAQRAKELTYQILSFSRQTEHEQVALDLEPIIKEVSKMLRATMPSTIEIKQNVPAGTGEVMADPVQIHQILMNLCTNAAQAMEESGGVLSIALDVVDIDDSIANEYVDLAPGQYQRLSVGDTGVGMDKEVLERIFEPFYTTKEVGKGTGMGLSVVHGIVKNFGGDITVYSEPGQGSTFHVYLPLADGGQNKEPALLIGEVPRGSENILFVDDEPPLVDIGKKTLSRFGYQVQGFTSAQEALEAFKAAPDYFNLLITDYTMPKITGVQLANEILAIKPDLPIIICTGFSERLESTMTQEVKAARLVMKPFMPREIARVVREVLDK